MQPIPSIVMFFGYSAARESDLVVKILRWHMDEYKIIGNTDNFP